MYLFIFRIRQDPYWNKLLWYCVDNNSYQGCALPERVEEFVKDYASYEEEIPQHGEENNWDEEPRQTEAPLPVTNEDEWSDGWK